MIPLFTRRASPDDYPHFERFFAELGVPDPVPSPADFAAHIAPHAILLEEVAAGAVVAYAHFFATGALGRVVHVVVDRDWHRQGVGRSLMAEVAARLRADGCTRWSLYVRPDNAAALGLYGSLAMRAVGHARVLSIAWADVDRLNLGSPGFASPPGVAPWPGAASPSSIAPSLAPLDGREDRAIEAAFRLAPGALSPLRAAGRIIVRGSGEGGVHSLAVFDPSFPGAMPFRTRRPELARPLLQAIRAFRLPAHDSVRLFVEDDAPLDAYLTSAGAGVVMEVLRMEGDL